MKFRVKFAVVLLLFAAISTLFVAGRNERRNGYLMMKNVEALADGETGWEKCVEVKGFCRNADGSLWTELLNIYQ